MEVDVQCLGCGQTFTVPDSMVGGLANCPGCGKVTPVRGLRDPLWRLWQVVWLLVVLGSAIIGFQFGGAAVAVGVILAGLLGGWLLSRAF